jgi:Trk K+ transport system NAD-binding subunit
MAGHIVICGMGEVGYRVASLLWRLAEPTRIVTRACRDDWRQAAENDGITVLCGDARDPRLLAEAGIRDARALIVATDLDAINVEITLDAKREHESLPIVARLFDQVLAQRLEETFGLRRALSMSAVAAPHFAAAALGERVAGSFILHEQVWLVGKVRLDPDSPLTGLTIREVGGRHGLTVLGHRADGPWIFAPDRELALTAGGEVTIIGRSAAWDALDPAGRSRTRPRRLVAWARTIARSLDPLATLRGVWNIWQQAPAPLRAAFVLLNLLIVLSVFLFHAAMDLSFVDALYFVVGTVTSAGGGDVSLKMDALKLYAAGVMVLGTLSVAMVYSIITDFIVTTRFQEMLGLKGVSPNGHVVVVGIGNVGYRVAEQLRGSDQRIVAIDRDSHADLVETVRGHTTVVVGDARLPDTLLKAGITGARAIVAVTHDDPTNLAVALAAKQLAPGIRTVVRVFDADFARKAQSALGIDVALSASMVAAPVFVAAALYPDVRHALILDDHLIALIEQKVGPDCAGEWQTQAPGAPQRTVVFRRAAGEGYAVADDAPLAPDEEFIGAICVPLTR